MKYINKFNSIDPEKENQLKNKVSNLLLNLADCLIEIFDKYEIPELNKNLSINEKQWWISNRKLGSPHIVINKLDNEKSKEIYDDISKIKNTIQQRIGTRIYHRIDKENENSKTISIFLSDYTYQKQLQYLKINKFRK